MRQEQDRGGPAAAKASRQPAARSILPALGRSEALSLCLVLGFVLLVLANGSWVPQPVEERESLITLDGGPPDELGRRIGQMLVFGFTGASASEASVRALGAEAKAGLIGGIVLLPRNIGPRRRLGSLVASLNGEGLALPLLVAVDQEGGKVQRLGPRQGYGDNPSAEEVAKGDPGAARALYRRMAAELQGVGINLNLGPVVDLAANADNPVISRLGRSYGNDASRVTDYARAFIEAHAEAGVLTALKHFPGHGSSRGDSHDGPVDISKSWSAAELEPFAALAAGTVPPIVMSGHLAHAELTGDVSVPASLSRRAIDGELRGRLRFAGVVMTDDLGMGAIRSRFPIEDAVIRAIDAGNDILLFASDEGVTAAFRARIRRIIRLAVDQGRIPRARIDASYERIRALKARLAARTAAVGG
jgi:beta-N-acetylhexosaminidase